MRATLVALATFAFSATASAQAQNKAIADAMFDDGLQLLRAGKLADACPKLAESERIDPAVGTALYLGECYERLHKIASAHVMFQEAFDLARRRGDARAAVAKDHHDKLVPSKLTIALAPNARVADMHITLDGTQLSQAELGVALPADGGTHLVGVSAPGKKAWSRQVDVPVKEGAATLTIPALEDEKIQGAIVATPSAPVDQARAPGRGRRLAAITTAGVGLVGVVLGAVAGSIAMADWNASNSTDNGCDAGGTKCPTQHGIDLRSSAQTWATVSTVSFVAGGVLLVAGAILFFTAPKARVTAALAGPASLSFRF
jgi:hypothetical protein